MHAPVARTAHRVLDVDGTSVFYRETSPRGEDPATLLMLHGFPSASHQYRRLIDALGDDHRLIAPDYPGFGFTEAPDDFVYSFDRLAEVVEKLIDHLALDRFGLYMFDFGAPVGFRIALRHSARITRLVLQNANAYDVGLTDQARAFIGLRPDMADAEQQIRAILTPAGVRGQYETGVNRTELLAPDAWTMDQHFLARPGRIEAQIALAFDYHSNVAQYPEWQRWMRQQRPPSLVLWGGRDPFFSTAGAVAYLQDLPDAELHVFPTGHFALEDHLPQIAPLVAEFLVRDEADHQTGRTQP